MLGFPQPHRRSERRVILRRPDDGAKSLRIGPRRTGNGKNSRGGNRPQAESTIIKIATPPVGVWRTAGAPRATGPSQEICPYAKWPLPLALSGAPWPPPLPNVVFHKFKFEDHSPDAHQIRDFQLIITNPRMTSTPKPPTSPTRTRGTPPRASSVVAHGDLSRWYVWNHQYQCQCSLPR